MVYSVDLVLKYAASQYEINIQLLNSFDLALSAEKGLYLLDGLKVFSQSVCQR